MKLHLRVAAILFTAVAVTQALANDAHHPAGTAPAAEDGAVMKQLEEAQSNLAGAATPEARQAAMMQGMQAMKQAMARMQMMDGSACKPGKASARSRANRQKMMDHMMQMMDQQSSMMQMMQ